MIVREVLLEEKDQFNRAAVHPLQSWEWGEFREKTGLKVIRLGVFEPSKNKKEESLKTAYQLTVHPISQTNYSILYFPRGTLPDETMIKALKKLGVEENALFIKLAPNVYSAVSEGKIFNAHQQIDDFLIKSGCQLTKPFFFEYSFLIDLEKSEKDLMAQMHPKTRYNLRLSQRHGVEVVEDNSQAAFETYLRLLMETTKRQHFYAHDPAYHQQMWDVLHPAGIAHLLVARYQGRILATWVLFKFNNTLYYPYGASTRDYKEVMPTYALMWAAINFGKKNKCQLFDLWGCLGPNPNPKDPWLGFHRLKEGFGGQLVKFVGTYDLVTNYSLYPIYKVADKVRWQFLKLKSKFR